MKPDRRGHWRRGSARDRNRRHDVVQQDITPSLEQCISNIQIILCNIEKDEFVGVDLLDREARDLGPCSIRVISVLQILGSDNDSSQKHTSTTTNRMLRSCSSKVAGSIEPFRVLRLKVDDSRLDSQQVVQRKLQCEE